NGVYRRPVRRKVWTGSIARNEFGGLPRISTIQGGSKIHSQLVRQPLGRRRAAKDGAVNRSRAPFAVSFRRVFRSGGIEFLRILRENRHGKSETLRLGCARLLAI